MKKIAQLICGFSLSTWIARRTFNDYQTNHNNAAFLIYPSYREIGRLSYKYPHKFNLLHDKYWADYASDGSIPRCMNMIHFYDFFAYFRQNAI